MSIHEIIISDHQRTYGRNDEEHRKYKRILRDVIERAIQADLNAVNVYNLKGEPQNHRAGSSKRLVIFNNSVQRGDHQQEHPIRENVEIYGMSLPNVKLLTPCGDGLIFTSNGVPFAEYHQDNNELCILFDLFEQYSDDRVKIFTELMKEFNERVWKVFELRHSWIHTSDKNALTKRFMERFKEQHERTIREDKEKLSRHEQNVEDYKRELKRSYDQVIRLRRQIELEESNNVDINTKLIKDLDLIVNHEKVSDLQIKDGKFIVHTPNIYAYTLTGKRYYIGNMRIEIKLEDANIKFFGDNHRRGYWGEDPHPHVKGSSGTPCLGNVASTIAELASRNEIYALVLMCIDYLESINEQDSAGAKCVMWDEVNEEGAIIRRGGVQEEEEELEECPECHDNYSADDLYSVYDNINTNGELYDERYVCENCRRENYRYEESVGEYVHNDIILSEEE